MFKLKETGLFIFPIKKRQMIKNTNIQKISKKWKVYKKAILWSTVVCVYVNISINTAEIYHRMTYVHDKLSDKILHLCKKLPIDKC